MSGELSLHATTPREPTAKKAPSVSFAEGARIGGYTILAPIGGGGMGRVFLAEDPQLARKVALKILPPDDADDEGRARFLREAQALARVAHKNVVQVFASGVDEGVAWMALEYVVGDPLGALVDGGAIDEETALSLCGQAARGLAAAHDVGVVHRDVKPDNLLLDENACVRVCDFGVALFIEGIGGLSPAGGGFVTQKGIAVGTPHFMAPEQARGGTIDARADAWGLGATLYTLLTGRPPFYGRNDEPDLDILARVLREKAPDVRKKKPVTAATAALAERLLEPDLDKRLADMREIAATCDDIADAIAAGTAAPEAAPPAPSEVPVDAAASAPAATSPAPATVVASAVVAPTTTTTATRPPASRARVLALALSFAGLGAVVTYRVAEKLIEPELPPAPPPQIVEVPAPPPPVEVKAPVEEPPPPPPPPPTAEELEALVAEDVAAHRAELLALLAMTSNDAKASVVRLATASGAVGDVTIDTISYSHAVPHFGAIEHAILTGDRARAEHAIDDLAIAKPFEALDLLERVATNAKDKKTREQARQAKDSLFHVEK